MVSHRLKRLAWFILPALLGSGILLSLFLLFPFHTEAQTSLEFVVTPTEQAIIPVGFPQFSIAITNTGAISLTNFVIRANQLNNCARNPIYVQKTNPFYYGPLILEPGESYTFSCSTYDPIGEDIEDTLSLTAETESGDSIGPEEIDVVVHAEHLAAQFDTEIQAVGYGDTALLTLNITNTGPWEMTNISVTPIDSSLADCMRQVGDLPALSAGQSTSFSCETTNLYEDEEVVVDIAATVDGTIAVSEKAYLFLDSVKGLALEISPDEQIVASNASTDLTVTLRNLDDLSLTNLALASTDFPAFNRSAGSLPDLNSGESYQFQCETTLLTTDDTYTMTASALLNNLAVTAVNHTTLNAHSLVDIEVSPNYLIIAESAPVTFTITATNNLITDTLTGVTVNNTSAANRPTGLSTDCAQTLADLAPGESITYTCVGTAVPGEPNQNFTLSGYTPADYEDSDANYHIAQADAYIGLTHTFLPVTLNNYHPPYSYPDLTIKSLSVSQISNNIYSVKITVENPSTEAVADNNNFFVNAYLTSNLSNPILVCSMQGKWFGAGQNYTCTGQITLTAGTHTIRAWADPYDTVTEEYEMNNTRDLEVTHE
ncbi:MAG: hypothetical protein H6652_04770 [Ardenticatenaceae bacterium]|nr:hypothetical protein [Ardenticatenaceae bacterium]MCB8946494.1 hypothetical protein [Ardenticatenaceae bacterium]